LLPLSEVLAAVYNTAVFTKKVQNKSDELIKEFGSELDVLLNASENKLKLLIDERIVKVLLKNREGKLEVDPGYDGVYGKLILDKTQRGQKNLMKFVK
jgi:PHP family Zn ribbon phosphoesterase